MKKKFWITLAGLFVLLTAGIVGFWWYFLRDDPDPRASLRERVETSESSERTSADGTWRVEQGAPIEEVFAGYRVQELFAGETIKNTATGRTNEITGAIIIAGTEVIDGSFTVNMTTIKSDRSKRDDKMRTSGLETNTFTEATFEMLPFTLPEVPVKDKEYKLSVPGKLTLHGVTRDVTVTMDARWGGNSIDVAGNAPISLAGYDIETPDIPGVTDVDDNGEMEFQLTFVPKSQ